MDEPGAAPQDGSGRPEKVDYRFLLANERTFLAWLRTALSLQIAGLGVLQFLTHGHEIVRYALGVGLVLAGSYVGLTGYLRYYANERAIRAGTDLTRIRASVVVVVAVVVLPPLAALALALSAVLT
jgi:putative membrane protein